MLDFSWSELLVIGIIALVVIGPKELPGVLRTLGQWMTKIRRMASEFQNQFHDAMREAELADLKKEVDQMAAQANFSIDPLEEARKERETAQRGIETAIAGSAAESSASEAAPQPTPTESSASPAASIVAEPVILAEPVTVAEPVIVAEPVEATAEPTHPGGAGSKPA